MTGTAAEHDTFSVPAWPLPQAVEWPLHTHTHSMDQAPDTTALVVCLRLRLPLCLVCF